MREFTTAAEVVAGEPGNAELGQEITMKIDGKEVTFLPVSEGALALILASAAQPLAEKIATAVNFFFTSLKDQRDVDFFKERMWNRADSFGPHTMAEIVEGLAEEWTANPTQSPSDSTGSQASTGGSSTESTQGGASTSSAFGLTDSAT